jgi:hypothetical protein
LTPVVWPFFMSFAQRYLMSWSFMVSVSPGTI